ncbi:hypothetical protein [Corynebacterium argentoratense]|nr:hypothetical protein [Corynebacterium argentoratense]
MGKSAGFLYPSVRIRRYASVGTHPPVRIRRCASVGAYPPPTRHAA